MSINPFLPPPSALSVLPKIPFSGFQSRFRDFEVFDSIPVFHPMPCFQPVDAFKHATHASKTCIRMSKTRNACIQKHAFACRKHAFACRKHPTCMSTFSVFPLSAFGVSSKTPLKHAIRTTVGPILGPLLTPYELPHSLSKPVFDGNTASSRVQTLHSCMQCMFHCLAATQ